MCADVCGSPASHGMCTHRHPCPPFSSLLWIQVMQRRLWMSIVSKLQVIGAEPRVWFQTHFRTGTESKSFSNPIPIIGLKKLKLVLLHFSREILTYSWSCFSNLCSKEVVSAKFKCFKFCLKISCSTNKQDNKTANSATQEIELGEGLWSETSTNKLEGKKESLQLLLPCMARQLPSSNI